jgi:ATP-dependent DNA ligase
MGSKRYSERLRFVGFDLPVLAGADLRGLSWAERRERLEILATAFEEPVELSPVVETCVDLARDMAGTIEGLVIKDRTSTYRDGRRSGWFKVKDRSWYDREAWRFDGR